MYEGDQRKSSVLLIILILKLVRAWELREFFQTWQEDEDNAKMAWTSLLRKIDTESCFDYALIIGEVHQNFLLQWLEVELDKRVLLNRNYTVNYDFDIFINNFITIIFMPNSLLKSKHDIEMFVKLLADKLNSKRFARIIFVEPQLAAQRRDKNIEFLLQMCEQHQFLNAILLTKDFSTSHKYYSFEAFPAFEMFINVYKESSSKAVYPDKMDNVYGAEVRTRPDQIMPRSLVYKDSQGRTKVIGYIAQFIRMYGKYINCTIKYPGDLVAGDVLFYRDFINWTQLNLLDIPCSITPMVAGNTTKRMSYMYEILNWCLMMPVEEPLSYKDFLTGYLNVYTILAVLIMNAVFTFLLMASFRLISLQRKQQYFVHLADVVANSQVILGHLGSSFELHPHPISSLRIVYLSLFVSGLLYTTTFSVRLNAFLTHPPVHQIASLDDMLKYKCRILAAQNEYKTLLRISGTTFLPYLSLFHITDSYKEFSEVRSSYDKSFSYPVTSSVWHIYDTQQKLFSKPLFRRSNICFVNLDIMGFILPPNSVHKQKLDTLITRVRDMGFLNHWLQNNFYDLVSVGKMSLTDISVSSDLRSYIQTKDFYFVLLVMFKAITVSFVVFVMEHLWFQYNSILSLLCFKPKTISNQT